MTTSNNGYNLIKFYEGCKLTAYTDSVGVLTIGYGHTSGVKAGDKITQAKADVLLKEDVARFEKSVNKLLTRYVFNQNEFDALVSFAFNLGEANLIKLTNNYKRNKGQIADAILLYNKAGGQVLKGLTRRRQAERNLFCTPVKGSTIASDAVSDVDNINPYTTPKTTVKRNSKGVTVKWVQWALNARGYSLTVDGVFGVKTENAVKAFQNDNGLTVDGVVGKNTRNALK